MTPVSNVYVLPRCKVELFTTGADNTLGSLVWTAEQVENLRVTERYDVVERRLTGVPQPQRHHTSEHHELTFDAIWNVDAVLARNVEYILAITWLNGSFLPAASAYVRRFYAGAMTDSRDLNSRDSNEFTSSNTITATSMTESMGVGEPDDNEAGDSIC